jgi:hypothetical protein
LIASAWIVTLARPDPPPDPFTAWHFSVLFSHAPGNFLSITRLQAAWLFSGLMLSLVIAGDLGSERRWRRLLLATVALTGASIVILGVWQILAGAPGPLWDGRETATTYFFATFFHRTFAGAFVNLVWPISAAIFLSRTVGKPTKGVLGMLGTLFWGIVLVVCLVGVVAQTSRFAHVCAFALVLAITGWLCWRLPFRSVAAVGLRGAIVIAACVGIFLLMPNASARAFSEVRVRWAELLRDLSPDEPVTPGRRMHDFRLRPDRFIESRNPIASQVLGTQRLAAMTCIAMLPSAGLLGFGPGTWTAAYPHFTDDELLRTFSLYMQFAHSDHLQFAVEHGVLGAMAYCFIILGAGWRGLRRILESKARSRALTNGEAACAASLFALAGVLIHGSFDFPLQIPSIALYAWVLVGLLWAERSDERVSC